MDRIISINTGKTVYKDGENCVKLYYSKNQAEVYEEAYKQVLVCSLGVRTPKIKGVKKIGENQAIIAEFVKGETLEKSFFETDDKSRVLQQLIDFQKSYHKIHTDKLPTGRKIFKSEILKCSDEKFREKALKLLNETHTKNELCHAGFDFSELLTYNGKLYSFGWGNSYCGDKFSDVAITFFRLFEKYGRSLAESYLNGYACVEEDKNAVKKWIFIYYVSNYKKYSSENGDLCKYLKEIIIGEETND